jgi:hypothetical protein
MAVRKGASWYTITDSTRGCVYPHCLFDDCERVGKLIDEGRIFPKAIASFRWIGSKNGIVLFLDSTEDLRVLG